MGSINNSRCECDQDQENPCGPDTECLNRMLRIECEPSVCPGGSKCNNQFFQKRIYPPIYTFNTGGKGWGLKVHSDLKKGDFVVEYVGEVIDHSEFLMRLKAKQDAKDESYYFLTLDNNRVIDAGPRGNLARFMNHSCEPNYLEGDQGAKDSSKKTLAVRYKTALAEAFAAFQQRQLAVAEYVFERQTRVNVKPPPYVRIRNNKAVGKVRIFDSSINNSRCEC